MTRAKIRPQLARARILLAALAFVLGCFACTNGGHIGSGGVLQQDWDKRRGPVVPHDTFPRDCSLCHAGTSWSSIRADFVFDHEKETGTALRGAHAHAECLRCHNDRGPVQRFAAEGCLGCHEDVHRGKQGSNCTTCHNESNWAVSDAIALHSRTRFPLFGVHAATECWRCHPGAQVGNFYGAPIECANCHQEQLSQATNPDHIAQGWTQDCAHCHMPVGWGSTDFNHSWFPLIGHHAPPERHCEDCHTNNVWHGLHNQCVDCHIANYQGSIDPPHVAAGIAQSCKDCHTPMGWRPAPFDHAFWPLIGNHSVGPRTCTDCHQAGLFQGTPSTCAGCHMADYNATTAPPHAATGYPTTCSNCHDTVDFHSAVFNHDSWPLTGTHRQTNCTACHTNNDYSTAPVLCYGCHAADYTQAQNPNHVAAGLPTTCEICHTTTHFTPSTFNHTALFPLTNGHAMPPRTCTDCHQNGNFLTTPSTCLGCHGPTATINPVYNSGSNMAHQQLGPNGAACTNCHDTTTWQTSSFDHSIFTLTGAHLFPTLCSACHTGESYDNAPTTCVGCHLADYNGTRDPPHQQSNFQTTCQDCHNTVGWSGANFSHDMWPLTGVHATTACTQCHRSGNYSNAPTTCVGCHLTDYNFTDNPPHVTDGFPQTCQTCHTTAGWTGANFDHSWWPLTGLHSVPPRVCTDCHARGNYNTNPPTACVGCHLADYNGTTSPPHATDGFPQTCDTCHTTAGWTGANFNHSWWPLTGSHSVPPRVCFDCHARGNYNTNPPTNCVGCHLADYNGTNSPPHAANNFAQTCQDCHNTTAWQPATFNHTPFFPLTGAHTVPPLQCTACHVGGNYRLNLPQTCGGCHGPGAIVNAVYLQDNPTHTQLGASPPDCSMCHGNTVWVPSTFDHTSYPLTGMHTSVACTQCHTGGSYDGAPTNCVGCHMSDYNGTTNPSHSRDGFPTSCETCHTTAGWTGSNFNHSWWPLTGLHSVPPRVCTDCHVGGNYNTNPPTACVGCHLADYNGTTNPSHSRDGFPQTCDTCHTTTGWTGANFNHSWWPLTGQHAVPPRVCTDCHIGGNYNTNPPTTCVGCHLADYNGTTSPPHASNNFPQTCQNCHTTTAWQPGTFTHTNVGFNLTGGHVSPPLACASCHVNGNYSGTLPTTCIGCHGPSATVNPVYNASSNTTHQQLGTSPPDCTMCHNNTTWVPSTFDHSSFPLTGQHVTTACALCHTRGNYTSAPTACSGCHMTDYNGTTNPNHAADGFPTTCQTCHTTAGWTGANFNHSWWPLTGQHAVPPRVCTDCHRGGNYNTNPPTDCVGCHLADYNGTTNPAHAANGFPQTCATCHNTTAWQPATFTHTGVGFDLTGAHVSPPLACGNCHVNGNYNGTLPTTCVGCHQSDYNGTSSPPHAPDGIPTNCSQCHTTNLGTPPWTPINMDHTGVTGACSLCHITDYNSTTNPAHEVQGYPITCSSAGPFSCHTSQTDWTPNGFNPATSHDAPPPNVNLPHHSARCNQCHLSTTDFSTFTCMSSGCHPQSQTNNNHSGVSGYQYLASACYNCHPNGTSLAGGTHNRPTNPLSRPPRLTLNRRMPPQRVPGPVAPPPEAPAPRRY